MIIRSVWARRATRNLDGRPGEGRLSGHVLIESASRAARAASLPPGSARAVFLRSAERIEKCLEILVIDLDEIARIEVASTGLDPQAQALEFQGVFSAPLLQGAHRVADRLAGILILAGTHDAFDELVLLVGQIDISGRHAISLPWLDRGCHSLAKIANAQSAASIHPQASDRGNFCRTAQPPGSAGNPARL